MRVRGHCPMGCGETLSLSAGGYIVCTLLGCPRPTAAADILDEDGCEHVIQVTTDGWTLRHPLRERLDDGLFDCDLFANLGDMVSEIGRPGRCRVFRRSGMGPNDWGIERLRESDGGPA